MARKARSVVSRPPPPDDPTTAWAKDVVAGRIVSGELAVAAAERHLRDLKEGHKRGLIWQPDHAQRALGFLPAVLSITAGAMEGKPFHPLPWHTFVAGSLFGWRRQSGRMRFRSAWLETGKGQAKALALDTPIPTPSGWTTMGDLQAGDEVLDDAGSPCRVVVAHPIVSGQPCYRVAFSDGSEVVANGGHLWSLTVRSHRGNSSVLTTTEAIAAALLDPRIVIRVAGAKEAVEHYGGRIIVSCERVPSVPVRCITVDSLSSMFLCGREMIPTHNSPFMAGIGIYLMGYYGIARSQVFSIGQDKATANVLFGDAVAMCRAPIPGGEDDDTLENRGEVIIRGEGDNAWKIEHPESGSVFRSLANGEAISGPRPTAVLADEIHEFKNNHSIETWKRAIAKMPGDAIMILGTNTPASNQVVGTAYSEFYQKVIRGEIVDDELFGFIARVDKKDRERVFDDESCWQKALPALGITFPIENIRGEVNTAKQLLSTALSVKRLYFGIPIGSTDFWIAEEAWSSVQGKVDPKAMRFQKCWLSLDLSQKNDLTALTAVWEDEDAHLHAYTWYWTTQEGLVDRAKADQQPYEEWAADPKVSFTATPGAVIDKTFVAAKVKEICAQHDVQFLAFDVAGMSDFIAACEQIGFDVWKFEGPDKPKGRGLALVPHAQGKRRAFEDKQLTMPTSIERLEDRILNKTITIDASPVTYSCAANAQVDADGQGNRAFDKKRSRGRIDGLVTLAMAVGAVEFETDPAGTVEIFAL